jgi:hypothetical protein
MTQFHDRIRDILVPVFILLVAVGIIIIFVWKAPTYCRTVKRDRLVQGATPNPYCKEQTNDPIS